MAKSALVQLDAETKVLEAPHDHKDELRLWLRLMTCNNLIEAEIRSRLRERFATTLPRFDLLAQLARAPDGMLLGELSQRMMVSAGNITGLVDRLVDSGQLHRVPLPTDRRAQVVKLTPAGRREFRKMAQEHEKWIATFFEGLSPDEIEVLLAGLSKLKLSVRAVVADRRPLTARGYPRPRGQTSVVR
ncbi:MAG: MarR family transcriptional regulator [Hyphomonadaceae bacterium]|nr:MarR family transcriptional regulator [Hyphomonadaceae bacterium]